MDEKKIVTFDIECLGNYFLCMFRRLSDGKVIYFEKYNDSPLDTHSLESIMRKYTLVSFNGLKYDQLIVEAAVRGFSNANLKAMSDKIIGENLQPWQARKQFGIRQMNVDHIDLIEVAPLKAGLKLYGARIHCKNLQDMPIHHDDLMTDEKLPMMREYCEYDNEDTADLYKELKGQVALRTEMSKKYDVDLRSKSDAQIAETVIKHSLGGKVKKPSIPKGTVYRYTGPSYLDKFQTPELIELVRLYRSLPITIGNSGHCELIFNPDEVRLAEGYNEDNLLEKGDEGFMKVTPKKQLTIEVGGTKYVVGIGGIHSKEKAVTHKSDEVYQIRDVDVEAFYPNIIRNNKYFPKHIGPKFLDIYGGIIDKRIAAKRSGDKVTNQSLKIVINGSFGKLGIKYSILSAPDLMSNVTITGHLTLLLLIERFVLAGISVLSANTDGIVIRMPRDREEEARDIIADWELDTAYDMEETDYDLLASRSVNAYIAVKSGEVDPATPFNDGDFHLKGKGEYADQRDSFYRLRSNPDCYICDEAVKRFLKCGTPIEETITGCRDIRKFLVVRTVTKGGRKGDEYLGKVVRWYYGEGEEDCIRNVESGAKIAKSDGAIPLMKLKEGYFPGNVDFARYCEKARETLANIGYNLQ